MSVMILLLAAEDAGIGALFFGVFKGERELRQALGVPTGLELLGALALGYPADPAKSEGYGSSAGRPSRPPEQIIRRGGWSTRGSAAPGQ
jgi:nitroreductase